MGLFTPPAGGKDSNVGKLPSTKPVKPDKDIKKHFYRRPSLGLTLWGPLVPASDNKIGLWSLLTIQTAFGLYCMNRFRSLRPKVLKKNVADFPSLNRFSQTSKDMYVASNTFSEFGGTHTFHRRSDEGSGFFASRRFVNAKRLLYLIGGSSLLVQSFLEAFRFTLGYDPWEEQAKAVRDKQFYNDVVKYYHEGVDPLRFKVKDATSGSILSVNIPEIKQGVAVARAHANADNIITKWLGPLDYTPLSFSEFLDKVEHYLNMSEFLENMNSKMVVEDNEAAATRKKELEELIQTNAANRKSIRQLLDSEPSDTAAPASPKKPEISIRGVTIDPSVKSPEDINLQELWTLYNPWVDLALDTSLSIKFLPTIRTPQELINENEDVTDLGIAPTRKENESNATKSD
ncbi:HCL657Cp [Eremothecium sinecaudum]|uniref:HCL657Cp n=1 Tax=Eremothecium sinecaudum TaxID=45286 RepID=A0A109UXV2_9SACH|nr:HCL657Cp [Eremothecium sinecaudum]AMD19494.1 HCL657Cp [Eremothecium sinecaudum]